MQVYEGESGNDPHYKLIQVEKDSMLLGARYGFPAKVFAYAWIFLTYLYVYVIRIKDNMLYGYLHEIMHLNNLLINICYK